MKKFLSLVLALVMTMSLVTVSAGAKDFTDNDAITYEEAVAVMSEIGVIDGYATGDFKPTATLTRGAAAKIICNLILGPTTASALAATTAPFSDVAADSTFAGYIAYLSKANIIGGYADGTFKPGNSLTGYAFLKMLLGALGYDADIEGYNGANYAVSVAKQAIEAGLTDGLVNDFDGRTAVTREEACQYAFNTLKAIMVEYDNRIVIGEGATAVAISGVRKDLSWNKGTKNDGNIEEDGYVQFAEQYFPNLIRKDDTDAFGRPANTWTWKSEEIGTYVDYATKVAEFTAKVKYKDLYEAIGKLAATEYDMYDYLDGVDNTVNQASITKKNDAKVPGTGKGVLTQVFLNNSTKEFSVVSINTYAAQAVSDYSEKADQLTLKIYTGLNGASITRTVKGEDFDIAGYEKDDVVLVTMSGSKKVVETIADPDVVSEVTVSTYSVDSTDANEGGQYKLGSVVANGEKYNTAEKAYWDKDFLFNYAEKEEQLKDYTYNLYLDAYGYIVGVENVADTTNYLFIVGYDIGSSVLAKTLDKALVIFPDGEMKTITCYEKDKNVKVVTSDSAAVNQWWTYTMDADGNYALKAKAASQFHDLDSNRVLDVENPTLKGGYFETGSDTIAYGNAKSVYITVESDTSVDENGSIVDVTAVSTGIKNTSINMKEKTTQNVSGAYVLYDGNYVKYAVVVGEDGSVANRYVYLTTGIGERSYASTPGYYWSYDAIVDGALLETSNGAGGFNTLKAKDENNSYLAAATLYDVSYDKDGYAKKLTVLSDNWTDAETSTNKSNGYVQITSTTSNGAKVAFPVTLRGQTLYFNTATFSKQYVMTADDCVFFVQNTDTDTGSEYVQYTDIDAAMAATGAVNGETYQITGKLVAICDKTTGFATTIIITDSKFENKDTATVVEDGWTDTKLGYSYKYTNDAKTEGKVYVSGAYTTVASIYTTLAGSSIEGGYYTTDANGVTTYTEVTATSTATVASVLAQDGAFLTITNSYGEWTIVTKK